MRERVQLVKGAFGIQSRPGEGTRIEARVPLAAAAVKSATEVA
jgi:signal transduction histidine kinase